MALTYLEQQKQYTEFLNELDALFRKHNIEHVYATDSTIHFSRSAYDTWSFGSWIMQNDGTRRYTRPGITEYILDSVDTDSNIIKTNIETTPLVSDTELSAAGPPPVDELKTQPELDKY